MTRVWALPLLGILLGCAASAQHGAFPPATGVIFRDSTAAAVLKQCTRKTPKDIESFWTPTDSVVRMLEPQLIKLLEDVLPRVNVAGRREPTRAASEYYRQYVGVVRAGERFVYVNGFPAPDSTLEHFAGKDYWRKMPMVVCDGGAGFFGVLYDVRQRQLERIEFNDSFSGRVRY